MRYQQIQNDGPCPPGATKNVAKMAVKSDTDLRLLETNPQISGLTPTEEIKSASSVDKRGLGIREAARGFLISLKASNSYSPRYLESLEFSIALLAS